MDIVDVSAKQVKHTHMTPWRHPDAWEGSHVPGTMGEQQFLVAGLQEQGHPHIHPTLLYLGWKAASLLLVQVVDGAEWWVLVGDKPLFLRLSPAFITY